MPDPSPMLSRYPHIAMALVAILYGLIVGWLMQWALHKFKSR